MGQREVTPRRKAGPLQVAATMFWALFAIVALLIPLVTLATR